MPESVVDRFAWLCKLLRPMHWAGSSRALGACHTKTRRCTIQSKFSCVRCHKAPLACLLATAVMLLVFFLLVLFSVLHLLFIALLQDLSSTSSKWQKLSVSGHRIRAPEDTAAPQGYCRWRTGHVYSIRNRHQQQHSGSGTFENKI
jgi:hypothetical protein